MKLHQFSAATAMHFGAFTSVSSLSVLDPHDIVNITNIRQQNVWKTTENTEDVPNARLPWRPNTLNCSVSSVLNTYCRMRRTVSSNVRPPKSPSTAV